MGGDVDDAGALAVLHALADMGEIELLAMGVVIGHEAAVPFVHAINTWYGRPDLPIGTIKGKAPYSRDEYMAPIVKEYPNSLTKETAEDVVKLYRRILASQPDKSVTLIAVGPATNVTNLLKSAPDEHSNLTGVALMRQKIKFYAAGGNGNAGLPEGRCGFNYYMDLTAARAELEMLPSDFPTVFSGGSGLEIKVGSALVEAQPDHIIRKCYEAYYDGIAQDRQAWDQLRVLFGTRPSFRSSLWDISPTGNITLGQDSVLTWTPTPDRNRSYAYVKDSISIKSFLKDLMLYDPRN